MHLTETRRALRPCVLAAVVVVSSWTFGAGPAAAQTGTIEGRVTAAATGAAITGAEVSVVGTDLGARTNQDGRFVLLNVPAGTRDLRVLAIGYKLATLRLAVPPDTMTTADVQLTASVLELDAVVVTGTPGVARVRELGNTVSRIDLAKDVRDPPANMDQLLQGRAPGLSVMQTSGTIGSGAQIRLRGPVSVTQSNIPIVYVDGVRVRSEGYRRNRPPLPGESSASFRGANYQASPLNDLSPADIERVEVIKGAAASTLYGTEAAAGVIQIFTRRGAQGAPRWSFETAQGFAQLRPFGTADNPYLNLRPKNDPKGQCHGNANAVLGCSWIRTGFRQRYQGSVAGGVERVQYFLSGGFEENDGVLPLDNERKVSTRGNFSVQLLDNTRVEFNTHYSTTRVFNTPTGNNAHGLTLNVYRTGIGYSPTGEPLKLDSLLDQEIRTDVDRLVTGATVYYAPISWLSNRFTLGYDRAQQENRNLRPFGFILERTGILFDEQIKFTTLTADYAGNVDYRLTPELAGTFSFGGQSITTEEIRTTAYGENFPGPGIPTVTSASRYSAREERLRVVNAGFFVQNVFKLRDRYFLTGGVRFDGNSAFGTSLGLQAYPKVSASYVISEEPFWRAAWGDLKLRGAMGWSGRAPGAFDAVRTWEILPSGGQPAYVTGNVGNPDIGPERTREIELGFDGAFLDNRVRAEFTWYHRLTSDALFSVRQIPSQGFPQSQRANVGKVRSAGIELALNATVFGRPAWGLDLGTTITTSHSLVLDLGEASPFDAGLDAVAWVEEGFPALAARGVVIRNPNQIAAPDTTCINCTADGFHIFGPQHPTIIWLQHVTLRLPKGVTLSARGEYQGGAWIQDGASFNALSRSVRWPTCRRAHALLDAAGSPPDQVIFNQIVQTQLTARERKECVAANTNSNTFWFPQDFWKLRDVTLTIPMGWAIKQVPSATLSLTAQNWVRWINQDLRMFDPEMVGRDALNEPVRDISEHIPPPAVFTASLRLTF
jgi:TonB-dependent SusC/RagA subfamily outer membrane receptor